MKVNMIKQPGGVLTPADEEAEQQMLKVKNHQLYTVDIKLNQNYMLHKKIFGFFKFCAQNYYGDRDVTQDQVEFTRKKVTMAAGYYKQIFYPDGKRFELIPKSISYEKLSPEERGEFYKKIVNAAMKNVFHKADEETFNRLMNYLY